MPTACAQQITNIGVVFWAPNTISCLKALLYTLCTKTSFSFRKWLSFHFAKSTSTPEASKLIERFWRLVAPIRVLNCFKKSEVQFE